MKPYYKNDKITLYLGDCREVLADLPEKSINMAMTSPPYDDLRTYGGIVWNFFVFRGVADNLYRSLKKGGVLVWVVNDSTENGSETITSSLQKIYFRKKNGFNIHDTMFYEKTAFSYPSNNRYQQVIEYVFVLSKGPPATVNIIKDKLNAYASRRSWGKNTKRQKDGSLVERSNPGIYSKYGARYNIWRYPIGRGFSSKDSMAFEHPAIFPERLAKDYITSWSNPGDTVLDPMCGSGTVLFQASWLKRSAVGIEISEEYCELIAKRAEKMKKERGFFL